MSRKTKIDRVIEKINNDLKALNLEINRLATKRDVLLDTLHQVEKIRDENIIKK